MTIEEKTEKIRERIKSLTKAHGQMNCYLFATIMVSEFGGEILYNGDHCIVEGGHGLIYDQTGFFLNLYDNYDNSCVSSLVNAAGPGAKLNL